MLYKQLIDLYCVRLYCACVIVNEKAGLNSSIRIRYSPPFGVLFPV